MNKYKLRNLFFDAPDDAGGGGERGLAALEDENPKPSVEAEPEPKPEPVVPFDPAAFAKTFATELAPHLKPAAPAEKELTPEEAKKLLNVWEPDDKWYAKFDNMETRNEALREQRDGLAKQYDTLYQFRQQEFEERMSARFGPLEQQYQQANAQAQESRLHASFPDLAKPEFTPLVRAIAQDFVAKGQTFPDEATLFKALASGVEAVIKTQNPNFKLADGSTPEAQTKKQTSTTGKIPVTSSGAGGGGGNTPPAAAKPRGLSVFDK